MYAYWPLPSNQSFFFFLFFFFLSKLPVVGNHRVASDERGSWANKIVARRVHLQPYITFTQNKVLELASYHLHGIDLCVCVCVCVCRVLHKLS